MAFLSEADKERLLGMGPNLLYHGTRHLSSILADNELARPLHRHKAVHFTSCPEEAARYAMRSITYRRSWPGEDGYSAILVLDIDALERDPLIDLRRRRVNNVRGVNPITYVTQEIYPLDKYLVGSLRLHDLKAALRLVSPSPADVDRHSRAFPARAQTLEFLRRRAEVSTLSCEQATSFTAELEEFLTGLPWKREDQHPEVRDLEKWLKKWRRSQQRGAMD